MQSGMLVCATGTATSSSDVPESPYHPTSISFYPFPTLLPNLIILQNRNDLNLRPTSLTPMTPIDVLSS